MAYVVVAYIFMAYVVVAYIFMAYVVVAYIFMAVGAGRAMRCGRSHRRVWRLTSTSSATTAACTF